MDSEDLEESRRLNYQWIEVFQHCSAEVMKMDQTLRSSQVLKQEAEDLGFEGKEILDYVKEQQKLDREERAEWRKIRMAELQAEDKKSSDEIQMAERANEIKIQIAQIEAAKEQAKIKADKELTRKELELKAQQNQASASLAATPPPRNKDAKSPKLLSFLIRRTK